MPLVWAHAEFVKLAASRAAGHALDRLDAVWSRYRGERPRAVAAIWTPAAPLPRVGAATGVWIVLPFPATLHLGFDDWREARDVATEPCGLGFHGVVLPAGTLAAHDRLDFTWRDGRDGRWHEARYRVAIRRPPG
jgi:glucoamylase